MEDNARKFIVDRIDSNFLDNHNSISFSLMVDWIITQEDKEKKIVRKQFSEGEVQLILVEKVITGDSRKTEKRKLDVQEYEALHSSSVIHLEKMRYEFNMEIQGKTYSFKYDEFTNSDLVMLEVDALTQAERESFKLNSFPFSLSEVTGDLRYYGYRTSEMI